MGSSVEEPFRSPVRLFLCELSKGTGCLPSQRVLDGVDKQGWSSRFGRSKSDRSRRLPTTERHESTVKPVTGATPAIQRGGDPEWLGLDVEGPTVVKLSLDLRSRAVPSSSAFPRRWPSLGGPPTTGVTKAR